MNKRTALGCALLLALTACPEARFHTSRTVSMSLPVPAGQSKVSLSVKDADRKSTRLNSSHGYISYAVFCLEKKSTRLNSSHGYISYAVFCLKKKSTRLNSSHGYISYAVFCLKKKSI